MGSTFLYKPLRTFKILKHENVLLFQINKFKKSDQLGDQLPFSKVKYKHSLYDLFKVTQLLEVGIQTELLIPRAVLYHLPLTHSTQIYLFSIYSTTGAALWRDTWARK